MDTIRLKCFSELKHQGTKFFLICANLCNLWINNDPQIAQIRTDLRLLFFLALASLRFNFILRAARRLANTLRYSALLRLIRIRSFRRLRRTLPVSVRGMRLMTWRVKRRSGDHDCLDLTAQLRHCGGSRRSMQTWSWPTPASFSIAIRTHRRPWRRGCAPRCRKARS